MGDFTLVLAAAPGKSGLRVAIGAHASRHQRMVLARAPRDLDGVNIGCRRRPLALTRMALLVS